MAAIIKHYAVLEAKEFLQKHHPNVPILNIVRVCCPVYMFVYFVTNKEAFIALVGQICMEACFGHKKKINSKVIATLTSSQFFFSQKINCSKKKKILEKKCFHATVNLQFCLFVSAME